MLPRGTTRLVRCRSPCGPTIQPRQTIPSLKLPAASRRSARRPFARGQAGGLRAPPSLTVVELDASSAFRRGARRNCWLPMRRADRAPPKVADTANSAPVASGNSIYRNTPSEDVAQRCPQTRAQTCHATQPHGHERGQFHVPEELRSRLKSASQHSGLPRMPREEMRHCPHVVFVRPNAGAYPKWYLAAVTTIQPDWNAPNGLSRQLIDGGFPLTRHSCDCGLRAFGCVSLAILIPGSAHITSIDR